MCFAQSLRISGGVIAFTGLVVCPPRSRLYSSHVCGDGHGARQLAGHGISIGVVCLVCDLALTYLMHAFPEPRAATQQTFGQVQ